MRLSHKRKAAHKRSGAAKGWARVVRARQIFREAVIFSASSAAEIAADFDRAVAYDDKPKPSLLTRGISLVEGALRCLKAAGEAQRNLLQGRQ